jgi:hypothetical protein
VVQQSLQTHCPSAAQCDPASLHLGAVAFIHRFGSSLNTHVHFHVCVVDGVFEAPPDAESAEPLNAQSVTFHPAQIDDAAIAQVQADVRKRLASAPLWHAVTWRPVTPKTWPLVHRPVATVVDFLWMPGCA